MWYRFTRNRVDCNEDERRVHNDEHKVLYAVFAKTESTNEL